MIALTVNTYCLIGHPLSIELESGLARLQKRYSWSDERAFTANLTLQMQIQRNDL